MNITTRMMFSGTHFKHYFLFLLLAITIILVFIKSKSNFINTSFDVKEIAQIRDISDTKIKYYTKKTTVEIRKLGIRKTEKISSKIINLQKKAVTNRIKETCVRNNLINFMERKHFLYSYENKALYCWIRKVASTSFTKIFSDMKNHHVTNNFYREADFLAPENVELLRSINKDQHTFKLLIVRHPFERLVSSYRDRIEDNTKYTDQAWIYVPKIFYLTRPELFRSNLTTGSSLEKMFYSDRRLKLIPTFEEFVTYLIEESSLKHDTHWNQYYRHCSVCEINYDFILKLEDYTPEQIDFIFLKLNLDRGKKYLPTLHQSLGGFTNFNRTCKYFRSLTTKSILQLYKKYEFDFTMFDYSLENYLRCS